MYTNAAYSGIIWRPIPNCEGLYLINNNGSVWGIKRKGILKATDDGKGYLQYSLSKKGKRKNY